MNEATQKHVFLIDGYGFLFRAYHSLPPLTNPEGTPVGAVYGFTNMLLKLRNRLQTGAHHHMLVVFDAGQKTFRNEIYPEYKAHRPPAPEDLIPQFDLVRQAADALSLPNISKIGFEADDIIATYAKQAERAGMKVTIVSSDKDLMQLVNDNISMYDAMKDRAIGIAEVEEKFGVPPEHVLDVLALMGDSSDNVPGVPSIGPKTAAELIGMFGDLEGVLAGAESVKQPKRRQVLQDHAEQARLSKRLVALDEAVEVDIPLEGLQLKTLDEAAYTPFLQAMGFTSLLTKLGGKAAAQPTEGIPAPKNTTAATTAQQAEAAPQAIPQHNHGVLEAESATKLLKRAEQTGYIVAYPLQDKKGTLLGTALGALADDGVHLGYLPNVSDGATATNNNAAPAEDLFAAANTDAADAPEDVLRNLLAPYLDRDDMCLIAWDAKALFHQLGCAAACYDDITLMRYVLHGSKGEHSPLSYNEQYLGGSEGVSDALQKTIDTQEADAQAKLGIESAYVMVHLHALFQQRLAANAMHSIYTGLERPLVRVLFAMEQAGIKLDVAKLQQLSHYFATEITAAEAVIFAESGTEFNVGSPKQLGEILFDRMQLPGAKKTKTGAYKTDSDILETLSHEGHKIADAVLRWRSLSKLKNTYSDALKNQVNPETQRIHTNFGNINTTTGRLSSFDPNLQNIPIRTEEGRRIRSCFVAEPGKLLIAADYSQIELRLLAHMGDITALKQAFIDGHDIHAATASEIFGVPIAEMDSETRRKAKAINFGIIYGQSAFGLAKQLGIGRDEAKDYIAAYFAKYPGIRRYMDDTVDYAKAHNYVKTLYGRTCFVPDINHKNGALRQFAERAAINAPLQGTAADIIKKAMLLVDQQLPYRMLLQVHDELVFEVEEAEAEQAAARIKAVMQQAAHLSVPLLVDAQHATTWREAH